MRKTIILFAALSFLFSGLVLTGCDKLNLAGPKKGALKKEDAQAIPAVKGTLIAKINNYPVTLEDLNQEISAFNALIAERQPEAKVTTRDQKMNYLRGEIVRRVLLYQDALGRGLDKKEEVLQALQKTKEDLLVMELVRQETEKVDVTSKEVEDYYNAYKDQMKEPEERQIREIMVPGEQDAKDIIIQLMQGADFATLAKEKSKSPSAKDGGDLGFIAKGKKFPQFDTVAFSDTLEVGKISNIFKGSDGYYIVKLEAKRGGKVKTLSEMWEDLKRGLTFLKQQRKMDELVTKLARDAKIEMYESEVK